MAAFAAFGLPVSVPEPGEYVADGAARQAAGVLTGSLPDWEMEGTNVAAGSPDPEFLARYRHYAAKAANH